MKIVYVLNNTWYAGGQTRVLINKVNYWAKQGHEVYILTSDQIGNSPYYEIDPRVKTVDYAIGYIGADQLSMLQKAMRLPGFLIRHYVRMKRTLMEIRPDIVVSMYGKEIFFLPFIKDGSAKVLEAHGARYTWIFSRKGLLGKLQNWLDIKLVRRFDQFVVLTQEDIPNWDVPNTICIPNGNTFAPVESATLDVKKVISSGRHGVQKNFENLVEAWAIVHAACPDWRLKICGQGLEKLDPIIDKLQLRDSIDRLESSDMQKEYMDSSISVVSSRHEGFSLALAEANACGVPNVSYACPCGPRDIIINGETGILVEELEDYHKLAEGIIRLIQDDELRKKMGKRAKELSVRFSEESVMQRWTKLFTELIAKKKKH